MKSEWTVPEAADLLGVSRTTIHNMIDRHELDVVKTAKRGQQKIKYISGASLERARAERSGSTAEEAAQPPM